MTLITAVNVKMDNSIVNILTSLYFTHKVLTISDMTKEFVMNVLDKTQACSIPVGFAISAMQYKLQMKVPIVNTFIDILKEISLNNIL